MNIPFGYCHCGCGEPTRIADRTRNDIGHQRGQPIRFISGHNGKGEKNGNWNNGRTFRRGRLLLSSHDHPYKTNGGYVLESRLICERVLGKFLSHRVVVHHIDENPLNNNCNNLVVCEDSTYHKLLHRRMRALSACGNVHFRKCSYCGQYDDPMDMFAHIKNHSVWHQSCKSNYNRRRRLQI